MYYLIGIDHEGKVHIIARANELALIKFMKDAHKISNNPNDWKNLKIMKDVEE
jgi:hypothetical protein